MALVISPAPWLIFLDDDGRFVPNGQLAVYQAGTTTPATVYADSAGTAHPWPITLDGAGRIPGGLYLAPAASYKFVLHQPKLATANLTGAIIKTQDHVTSDSGTVTITGSVPTSADLPTPGLPGDAYIAIDTGHLWVWDDIGNVWVDAGPVQGPPGAPGAPGPAGPTGPPGPVNTGPSPFFDLIENPTVLDPAADIARLFALDQNGFSVVEVRDSNANVVRLASDNILIGKVAGTGIGRGQVVYISGASGANVLLGAARADAIATMPGIGLALDPGAPNAFIRVLLVGTLQLIDTSMFAEGASLFVSPTTAGAMTTTLPTAPAFAQRIGFVTRSHATQGEVVVLTTGVDGPPRLHAPTHAAGGTDPVTVTALAGYPGGATTFLRADGTFAVPAGGGGGGLPTDALGKVLISQGAGVDPIFSAAPLLEGVPPILMIRDASAPADLRTWRISTFQTDGTAALSFRPTNDAGVPYSGHFLLSVFGGGFSTTGNGAVGGKLAADLQLVTRRFLEAVEQLFASLAVPDFGVGALANISDSNTAVLGAVIAGGGTNHVLARYDGAAWRVVAGVGVTSGPPALHHATHEPGGSDALVNAAWTNLANVFTAVQTTPGLTVQAASGVLSIWGLASPANTRRWNIAQSGGATGELSFVALDDSGNTQAAITFLRTGAAVFPGGLGITPLNATSLTTGTLPDARLSANVLKVAGGYPGGTATFLRSDGAFAAPQGTVLSVTTGGTQILNVAGVEVVYVSPSADLIIQGMSGGIEGQQVLLRNITAPTTLIQLQPRVGGVPTAQQLYNTVTIGPTLLVGFSAWARYVFLGGTWVMTGHEQGDPWKQPHNTANYGGQSGMTWTVSAVDAIVETWYVVGRVCFYNIQFGSTTIGGTVSNSLTRLLPLGWTPSLGGQHQWMYNSVSTQGIAFTSGGSVLFLKGDLSNWPNITGIGMNGLLKIQLQ